MNLFRALFTYTLLAGTLDYLLGRKLRYRYAVVFRLGEEGFRVLDRKTPSAKAKLKLAERTRSDVEETT